MGMFTKVAESTFDELQLDAGVILKNFSPASPAAPADADIVCATTGGVEATCVPTYSDMGEDIDNCPNNTKELKHLDSWECRLATTALNVTADTVKLALGAATKTAATQSAPAKVEPNAELSDADFTDLWWVGDRSDGGMAAIKLVNALSTGGFSLQTTKAGKGQLALELTGHISIDDTSKVPMEFYVAEG